MTKLHSARPPTASTKEPEEREFVVDSGASTHMVSKRDLHSSELEIMRISRSPTTVLTANGEVQTREEATVARVMGSPRHAVKQAAADPRGSRTCVCANTFSSSRWHTQEGEGRIDVLPWYRLVGVAIPSVSRKGGRTRLPARVSGRHVVRGRQSSPVPAQASRVSVAVRSSPG